MNEIWVFSSIFINSHFVHDLDENEGVCADLVQID